MYNILNFYIVNTLNKSTLKYFVILSLDPSVKKINQNIN